MHGAINRSMSEYLRYEVEVRWEDERYQHRQAACTSRRLDQTMRHWFAEVSWLGVGFDLLLKNDHIYIKTRIDAVTVNFTIIVRRRNVDQELTNTEHGRPTTAECGL